MTVQMDIAIDLELGQPVHATAIVLGEKGFLFTGRSGSGKTQAALSCLAAARRCGHFAALVSDDRVLLEPASGRLLANCPAAISGMAEIRGSGVFTFTWRPSVAIDCLIAPGRPTGELRIPPTDENCKIGEIYLPVLRIDYHSILQSFETICAAGRFGCRVGP